MSRRVYLLGMAVALVALALAFTDWALSLRPGVTEANVRRIRPGMALAQVEALLADRGEVADFHYQRDEWPRPTLRVWEGPTGLAWIRFDETGRSETAVWVRRQAQPAPLARLRAWLGW